MATDDWGGSRAPESRLNVGASGDSLLLQLRSDRRLGHEWDDWDGKALPDEGVFQEREAVFFQLAAVCILGCAGAASAALWLLAPRLAGVWGPLEGYLTVGIVVAGMLGLGWLIAIAIVLRTGRNWIPERLAERGLMPWMMPKLERIGVLAGLSRDRIGNAMLRVFNRLSAARATSGIAPDDLLILLPRCLGKDAMQTAMSVSSRYGVPLFVAARGRYARQMISLRRPKGIVAVACERDLVSGVHDVARHLPVLGTTLKLADGPCRNTGFAATELEEQVRRMLGLPEESERAESRDKESAPT